MEREEWHRPRSAAHEPSRADDRSATSSRWLRRSERSLRVIPGSHKAGRPVDARSCRMARPSAWGCMHGAPRRCPS